VAVTNDVFEAESRHYVTVWMLAACPGGTPEVREPDKFVAQSWFAFDALPAPLFLPMTQLLRSPFIDDIRRRVGVAGPAAG
jgi:8-oxo-dGTP diphosphatase